MVSRIFVPTWYLPLVPLTDMNDAIRLLSLGHTLDNAEDGVLAVRSPR